MLVGRGSVLEVVLCCMLLSVVQALLGTLGCSSLSSSHRHAMPPRRDGEKREGELWEKLQPGYLL